MKSNNSRETSCDGKIPYNSKAEASAAAASLGARSRVKKKINSYKCQYCNKYHVGNSRHKKKRGKGYGDKPDKPLDLKKIKIKHGVDKGFYFIKTNLHNDTD
jgi:hypothetical protein